MTKSLRAFHIVHNVTQGPTQICNLSFLQTPMQPISEQIYYVGWRWYIKIHVSKMHDVIWTNVVLFYIDCKNNISYFLPIFS
jgi:hypothetical protein